MDFGTLYVVATPIGNLADTSDRVIKTLSGVDLVLAEDTRETLKLLSHFKLEKKLFSYHQQSAENTRLRILSELNQGKDLALVSDAGTPGINDPGNELVAYLVSQNPDIKIVPIPGPSAVTAALSICGFVTTPFIYLGYFPKKGAEKLIEDMKSMEGVIIYFDTAHRIIDNLRLLEKSLEHSRKVFVARELTKKFETTYRGFLVDVRSKLEETTIRGEFVVVLDRVH